MMPALREVLASQRRMPPSALIATRDNDSRGMRRAVRKALETIVAASDYPWLLTTLRSAYRQVHCAITTKNGLGGTD